MIPIPLNSICGGLLLLVLPIVVWPASKGYTSVSARRGSSCKLTKWGLFSSLDLTVDKPWNAAACMLLISFARCCRSAPPDSSSARRDLRSSAILDSACFFSSKSDWSSATLDGSEAMAPVAPAPFKASISACILALNSSIAFFISATGSVDTFLVDLILTCLIRSANFSVDKVSLKQIEAGLRAAIMITFPPVILACNNSVSLESRKLGFLFSDKALIQPPSAVSDKLMALPSLSI
mmetsp:Transcript_2697/g.5022  ORF Transcript_2697/g.5022 Transcript_2697/m.5022 type:complete len:237 (-) Transcript_2697:853-1563(-)